MRIRILALALFTLFAACTRREPAGGGGAAPEKVRIGVGGETQFIYLPLRLAERLGYFREAGLDIDIVNLRGGSEALTALAGGSVDVVCGFYEHTIRAQAQGKELVMFALLDLYPGMVLMVGRRHANEVRSIRDLAGHPVGVTAPGSSTDAMVKFLLKASGLDPQAIPVVTAGSATMAAAIRQDQVWAGVAVDPIASTMEQEGIARPLYDTRSEAGTRQVFGGAWPAGGFYAPRAFLDTRSATAQALARAAVRTLRYLRTHTAREIAEKMPPSFVIGGPVVMDRYVASLEANLAMFSPDGRMPSDAPPSVLRTIALVDPRVAAATIDLARTYDNRFVEKVE